MNYLQGTPRKQMVLFAESLDGLVSKDDPVRFIDAYVETQDLGDLQIKEKKEGAGRPAYHPKLMLKIYIYGYLNRIRSSRKLMRECMRNVELIWLCEQLTPDYRTISDFRKENPQMKPTRCVDMTPIAGY